MGTLLDNEFGHADYISMHRPLTKTMMISALVVATLAGETMISTEPSAHTHSEDLSPQAGPIVVEYYTSANSMASTRGLVTNMVTNGGKLANFFKL